MSVTIKAQERNSALLLRSPHSQLEFLIWRAEFRLMRGDRVLFQSGKGWGHPVTTLSLWQVDGDRAVLTYNRGAHGLGRLMVTALEDGWRLVWDQLTHDTFNLSAGGHWYGMGELVGQTWPLETMRMPEAPYLVSDGGAPGAILSPVWLTSTGVALAVDSPSGALCIGLNAPSATDAAGDSHSSRVDSGVLSMCDRGAPLNLLLLVGTDISSAFRRFMQWRGKPARFPPEGLFRAPIWEAGNHTAPQQETLLQYATVIRAYDMPGTTLNIVGGWQNCSGDFTFDERRFPTPAWMIERLGESGFNVILRCAPLISPNSVNFAEVVRHNLLVQRPDKLPFPVLWRGQVAYLLDLSNPYALEWWADRLWTLKRECGLSGYAFDGRGASLLAPDAVTHSPVSRNEYSALLVDFAAQTFPFGTVNCGWNSQHQAILFQQMTSKAMRDAVRGALSLTMSGYLFTSMPLETAPANQEQIIRWMQASAGMFALSIPESFWEHTPETIAVCRKYARLFTDLFDARLAAAQASVDTGEPVIRPIFWSIPRDADAQVISDEYLMGEDYLFAPVLWPGVQQRDIYLPPGRWRDYWSVTVYEGGRWLRDYPAPLDMLPLFVRV